MSVDSAWQLQMFRRTLKKRLRLKHLRGLLGSIRAEEECLLITCGDNNGAINHYLRKLGGHWSFADLESSSLDEMSTLLGTLVSAVTESSLPYDDNSFDRIVVIDTHEHVLRPHVFTGEVARVARPDGQIIITVPGGDRTKFVNRLKEWIGMTKDKYGHVREGFSAEDVKSFMRDAELEPGTELTFSKFFTEMIELMINYLYVNVLSGDGSESTTEGTIAPQTLEQVQSVGWSYRLYSGVYPIFWLVSQLDRLVIFSSGYVVMVEGHKRGNTA